MQNPSGDGSRQMPGKTAKVKKAVPADAKTNRAKTNSSSVSGNSKGAVDDVEDILARIKRNHARVVATMEKRYRS